MAVRYTNLVSARAAYNRVVEDISGLDQTNVSRWEVDLWQAASAIFGHSPITRAQQDAKDLWWYNQVLSQWVEYKRTNHEMDGAEEYEEVLAAQKAMEEIMPR